MFQPTACNPSQRLSLILLLNLSPYLSVEISGCHFPPLKGTLLILKPSVPLQPTMFLFKTHVIKNKSVSLIL